MQPSDRPAANEAGNEVKQPADLAGYLYILHDGMTGLTKIGCTRAGTGARQRAIIGAHGSALVNVVNAKVANRRAAELQCHAFFATSRTNGEWFNADLGDIITYVGAEVDWHEISFESQARMTRYMMACRAGDVKAAKLALTCKIPSWTPRA